MGVVGAGLVLSLQLQRIERVQLSALMKCCMRHRHESSQEEDGAAGHITWVIPTDVVMRGAARCGAMPLCYDV